MLPLYTGDVEDGNNSSFRIRQRATTPASRRRRPPQNISGAASPSGNVVGAAAWQPPPQLQQRRTDEVTILIPDDDDETTTTTKITNAASTLSSPNAPKQRRQHRPNNNRHALYDPSVTGFVKNRPWMSNKTMDYQGGGLLLDHHHDDNTTDYYYHTVFRTPHFVTDAEYQRHLRGEPLEKATPPLMTNVQCANFCMAFSMIATFVLTFLGFLLDTQALYIRGTLPSIPVQSTVDVHGHIRNTQVYEYLIPDTERLPIATTAYRTALLYFMCAMASWYYIHRHHHPTTHHPYTRIPETQQLPTFVLQASHDSVWQRVVRRVKRHARYRRNKQEKKG